MTDLGILDILYVDNMGYIEDDWSSFLQTIILEKYRMSSATILLALKGKIACMHLFLWLWLPNHLSLYESNNTYNLKN